MKINNVIIKPLITEKSTSMSQNKVYAFQVHSYANKNQVAEIIQNMYGVEVESVRMMMRKGKEKRVGRKMIPKMMPDTKVAYIKIKKGTIDLFPQS